MASYQEEIAQIRAQRAQQDYIEQQQRIIEDYQQAAELRDAAAQRGDAATFDTFDRECETLDPSSTVRFAK